MPEDFWQNERDKDHSKRHAAEYATNGRSSYERITDELPATGSWADIRRQGQHTVRRVTRKKEEAADARVDHETRIVEWLNRLRQRNARLAERIPEFNTVRTDKESIVPLIGFALENLSLCERVLMGELVEQVGKPAVKELEKFLWSTDKVVRKNASAVLDLLAAAARNRATGRSKTATKAPRPTAAARMTTARVLVECSICKAQMLPKNVARHMRRVHRQQD